MCWSEKMFKIFVFMFCLPVWTHCHLANRLESVFGQQSEPELLECPRNSLAEQDLFSTQSKKLGVIFDEIKKEASVSNEERKRKRHVVMNMLKELLIKMREDTLFNAMFSELIYTGSYFDKLRITNANEFDINVVLKLPVRKDKIKVETSTEYLSTFAVLRVDSSNGDPVVNYLDSGARNRFLKFLDAEGRVIPTLVLSWMQSVLEKASSHLESHVFQLTKSASGPARTLKIKLNNEPFTIDVDLVAVFRFERGQWVDNNQDFQSDIVEQASVARQRMYLVPKSHPELPACMWRKHFPEVEKELLRGTRAAKPIIRIMKLLRDNRKWKKISSYYLKTVVMIEVHRQNATGYWNDKRTPLLVFTMMQKLKNYFKEKTLPHLLFRNVNLFEGLHPDELNNHYHELQKIYKACVSDLDKIKTFFIQA